MRLPTISSTTPFRAWAIGATMGLFTVFLPFIGVFVPLPIVFAPTIYVIPLLGVAVIAAYSLVVRPRLFAASGVLLGIAPLLAWGVISGLQQCARFNRGNGSGGCEADPSAQVLLTAAIYAVALVVTAAAARSVRAVS